MRRDAPAPAPERPRQRIWILHDTLLLSASARRSTPAGGGYVIAKGQRQCRGGGGGGGGGNRDSAAAVADARSHRSIRAALEGLEGDLRFLRVEQDAAFARLQQSCILLVTRLGDHRWRRHRVIEETLAFVGEELDKTLFTSQVDVCEAHNKSGENGVVDSNAHGSNIVVRLLSCSLAIVKNSIRLERICGVLGNTAVLALGMLAFVQVQQVPFHKQSPTVECRRTGYHFHSGSSRKNSTRNYMEVSFARG